MKCLAHWNASLVSVVDGEHTVNQKGGALMDDSEIAKLADVLEEASRTGVPIEPLSTTFPTLDILSAYRVQGEGIRRRVGAGAVLKGHKVGLTSAAMQSQLGVDQPDAGCLLSDMFYPEREPVPVGSFIQPRVEPEIAFVLDAPLAGPGATVADAARAVGYVMGSIELIDSRIQDWQITIGDTIADNASRKSSDLLWKRSASLTACPYSWDMSGSTQAFCVPPNATGSPGPRFSSLPGSASSSAARQPSPLASQSCWRPSGLGRTEAEVSLDWAHGFRPGPVTSWAGTASGAPRGNRGTLASQVVPDFSCGVGPSLSDERSDRVAVGGWNWARHATVVLDLYPKILRWR